MKHVCLCTIEFAACEFLFTCVPGENATAYTETYGYVAAGGVSSKTLAINRINQDDDGDLVSNSASVAVNYTYDSAGRQLSTTYPFAFQSGVLASGYVGAGVLTFTYGFDGMGRPASLTDNLGGGVLPVPGGGPDLGSATGGNTNWVQGVTYDAGGRMTSLQRYTITSSWDCTYDDAINNSVTESMTYNVNGQMTFRGFNTGSVYSCFAVAPSRNNGITYSFSGTQNNGQITQAADTISGETISYTYDALKRLTEASSTASWVETYGYDGFGNLTSKVLNGGANTAPPVNSATNQLTSGYDLNGNNLSAVGATLTYDKANRLASAAPGPGTQYYGYAPDNKRIYVASCCYGGEKWTFYGAYGEKVGVFQWVDPVGTGDCLGTPCYLNPVASEVWFAGRLIWEGGAGGTAYGATYQDRLGTNRAGGARFYPYGEEITGTLNDREKFGTYTRDSFTTLDYADQRYYASAYGRFNTVDPLQSSAMPNNPGSWNRYAYVGGDPVNLLDPRGMEQEGGGCGPDWTSDPSLSGPCCPPAGSGFVEDPSVDPACYVGGVDSGSAPGPPPSPKCWQNTGKIGATLSNLGTDIEADVSGRLSSTDLQALTSDINSDIATEMAAIGGGTTSSPYYIGGHFNFDISDSQINAFSSADAQLFSAIFAGTTSDGIRQSAATGLALAGNYTLHSHDDNTPGDYSFHFDRFNPQDLSGLVGHGIYDVVGGHLGHPCLDPAWH